jgi:hemolysin activation/secretion protein
MSHIKHTLKSTIITAIVAAISISAYAQIDTERAVREVDRPIREEVEKKLRVPPEKPPEIKVEEERKIPEGPKFFVKKIELVGMESFSPDEFSHIVEKYENKELSLGELYGLAREIEKEYLKRGIIAACFILPQDIKEGVVILQVVEAQMGVLKIKDHNFFDKDRIAYWWSIRPGEVLTYDKITRSLQLMNKNPDREVKATLYAGKKPRTTDVLLDVKTRFPIHPFFTFDREGILSSGRERCGFGVRHNNFLFVDDIALAGYTFGKHFHSYFAYHSIPITNFGTYLHHGYSYSESTPKKQFQEFDLRSHANNASFFLYQNLITKGEYIGELYFGTDLKDKTVTQRVGTTNRDKLTVLRLGSILIHRFPGCVTYITPQVSQGINLLGARRKSELSSRGAENTFFKFNLGIKHKRALPFDLNALLNFKCQLAGEKLTPQEEYGLGGIDSVRGYPPGDFLADNALQTNFELLVPAFFIPEEAKLPYAKRHLKEDITGLVFFDYGYGRRRGALKTEDSDVSMASFGTGIRIRLLDNALLRLEWGFPVGDRPISESADSRFHFAINFEI